jgi:hypothetical protein
MGGKVAAAGGVCRGVSWDHMLPSRTCMLHTSL